MVAAGAVAGHGFARQTARGGVGVDSLQAFSTFLTSVPMPQHALIIGTSRGLGLGLVAHLQSLGWHVTATVRDPSRAAALQALAQPTAARQLPIRI